MSLLLAMLPFYLLGNLHCLGMCGPLVMMIGRNKYKHLYFIGRAVSFSLAAMLAGELGAVLHVYLKEYHISSLLSFLFGGFILAIGLSALLGRSYPGEKWIAKKLQPFNKHISLLVLKETPWALFLFGFFTVFLPCGQTVIVFSACALYGSAVAGLLNGFVFALLTSPSLALAMHASGCLNKAKKYYNVLMGSCALLVGVLAFCRGAADMDLIPHLILNSSAAREYHIIIF